jgi:hypothetical protein
MSKSKRAPTPARRVVRDEANALRLRFQAARMSVPKMVHEMASGAALVKMADQLSLLTDTMLGGPWSEQEAEDAAARLAVRIVRERVRQIRCRDRKIA